MKKIYLIAFILGLLNLPLQAQNIVWHTFKFGDKITAEIPVASLNHTNATMANFTSKDYHATAGNSNCIVKEYMYNEQMSVEEKLKKLPSDSISLTEFYTDFVQLLKTNLQATDVTVTPFEKQGLKGVEIDFTGVETYSSYHTQILLTGVAVYTFSYASQGPPDTAIKERFFSTITVENPETIKQTIGTKTHQTITIPVIIGSVIALVSIIALLFFVVLKKRKK